MLRRENEGNDTLLLTDPFKTRHEFHELTRMGDGFAGGRDGMINIKN